VIAPKTSDIIKDADISALEALTSDLMAMPVYTVDGDGKNKSTGMKVVMKLHNKLIDKLTAASLSGKRVNLKYKERYSVLFFRGETKHFAVGLEESVNSNAEKEENFLRR